MFYEAKIFKILIIKLCLPLPVPISNVMGELETKGGKPGSSCFPTT